MSRVLSKSAARFKAALASHGFAIGGVPPADHREALHTFLDADLKQYREIWAAACTPFAVFRLTPADLPAMTGGEWLDVADC